MSPNKNEEWSPRFWEGADFFVWLELLARNRFAVGFPYWYIAGIVTGMSFLNTCLRWWQEGQYGSQIDATPIDEPPIFVLGHWRTGTTLLHELLVLDEQFTSPNTAHCFMPCHFLLSEDFFRRRLRFLLPGKRPMDNMAAGWERPQEDEFGLVLLGEPSTYAEIAFPNHEPLNRHSLDLSNLTARQRNAWKKQFRRFIQAITLRDPRRMVLKSPPHTARVPLLLEAFPEARFIHIRRDPYTLYASTMNLWRSLGKAHGFQTPDNEERLSRKVFEEFRIMHQRYEEAKPSIPNGHLVEVTYEELIDDIPGTMEHIYRELDLEGFDKARPALQDYVERSRGYKVNAYQLDDATRAKIDDQWGDLIDHYQAEA